MSMFQITRPAENHEGCHSILYGPPKFGKTSTLGDCGFRVLLGDLEGGTSVLKGFDNVQRIDIKAEGVRLSKHPFEVLGLMLKEIETGVLADYDLFVIDSITEYEAIVKDYVATKYAPNRRREIQDKFGAQADWGDLKDLITRNVRYCHSLTKRGAKSVHIMWIAHSVVDTDANGLPTTTKVQLQGKNTSDVVMSIVDALFYMYKTQTQTNTDKPDEKPNFVSEYGILTQSGGIFQAEVRQPKNQPKLPPRIPNPRWSEIFEQLGYMRQDSVATE